MLVELFSLPGAGKTTLVKAVAPGDQLRTRHQISAVWGSRSSMQRFAFTTRALLNPANAAPAARLALAAKMDDRETLFRLLRLVAKGDWLRRQDKDLLFDQGLLQDLWSILYRAEYLEPDEALLSDLIAALYRDMKVHFVLVHVDPEIARRRIRERDYGRSRLDGLGDADLEATLSKIAHLPGRIADAATAAGFPLTVVDGQRPVHELAGEVRPLLPAAARRRLAEDAVA